MRVSVWLICVLLSSLAVADEALQRAVTLYEQGELDAAESQFKGMQSTDPGRADTYYYLGLIERSRGEFLSAAELFEEAVERDQRQSTYYQALGEAYGSAIQNVSFFKQMKMSKKIKSAFEKAVELDPDNIDARAGLVTWYANAPGIAGGSTEQAREQAKEIASRDTFRGHLAMATVFQTEGDDEAAEREYRAAIEDSPDEMDAYLVLGIFLTSKERYADAMQVYDEALARDPTDMDITYQVGRTASISGEYLERGKSALTSYLEYTPLPEEPGLDWANYRLGLVYQQLGDKEQARECFEQALAINADHAEAKKALKKIKR